MMWLVRLLLRRVGLLEAGETIVDVKVEPTSVRLYVARGDGHRLVRTAPITDRAGINLAALAPLLVRDGNGGMRTRVRTGRLLYALDVRRTLQRRCYTIDAQDADCP